MVGMVDTNLTGLYLNLQPKLYRDVFGNVTFNLPNVYAYFAGGTNPVSTWDLYGIGETPQPNTLAFQRYLKSATGDHWVTTGTIAGAGYHFEKNLGYLYMTPQPGTVPLFGCWYQAVDHFISPNSACEGQFVLGVNGWIYSSPPQGISTEALYRCERTNVPAGTDHFVSTDPNCEGFYTEMLLGYARTSP